MKVISRATFRRKDNRQMVFQGKEVDLPDAYAKELERNKMVVFPVGSEEKPKGRKPTVTADMDPEAAGRADTDPSSSAPTGGPTGDRNAKSSSSAQARRRTAKTSTSSAVEPASSPSTRATGSRRGRTASTRATGSGGKSSKGRRTSKG